MEEEENTNVNQRTTCLIFITLFCYKIGKYIDLTKVKDERQI
jgi:hypothetical protein